MDLIEALKNRHSVRKYLDKEIPSSIIEILNEEIVACNIEGNLDIKLITNEPNAFKNGLFNYGKFIQVNNYLVLSGKIRSSLYCQVGYFGQRIVLKAQSLGLNSCWVALNYHKKTIKPVIEDGHKLVCLIAIGYGVTSGSIRKSKKLDDVADINQFTPPWFIKGLEAALLAPTALNQQKFRFELNGNIVSLKAGGFYSQIDLGIVRYNFEIGAGIENFKWQI